MSRLRAPSALIPVIAFLTLALVRPSAAETLPTSPSYAIRQTSLSTGAESSTSASFVLTPTVAQELTIGTSASPGFVLQSGFWSVLGSGLVPVVLTVGPGGVADEVNLVWSGTNPPYEIFRATDCAAVFDLPLTTTTQNQLTGVTTAPGGLTCLNVLAAAPGPAPPPVP